jgi:ribosomal protein S18 acetylase RimI-like enzyme
MVEHPKSESHPLASPIFRFATADDVALISELDSFSNSPTRDIHREMEKYFGSVDPSTHERTIIFLAEMEHKAVAKAELMLPPPEEVSNSIGYIKRVVVHPDFRVHGLARQLLQRVLTYAHDELHLAALDLHVWEGNQPAVRLYQSLGFELQHRELYFRLPLQAPG